MHFSTRHLAHVQYEVYQQYITLSAADPACVSYIATLSIEEVTKQPQENSYYFPTPLLAIFLKIATLKAHAEMKYITNALQTVCRILCMLHLNNKKPNPRLYLFILLTFLPASTAFATCTSSTVSVTMPNLALNLNSIPLSGKIGSEVITAAKDIFTCNNNTGVTGRDIQSTGTSTGTINGIKIFPTGTPGISYAMALEPTNFCSNTILWSTFLTCKLPASTLNINAKIHIQLYRTGQISTTNNITISDRSMFLFENHTPQGDVITALTVSFLPFNLTVNTCSLQSSSITNITLPTITSTSLPSVNSVAGARSFSLTINCPGNTNLNITFTDNNNTSQTSNILTPASASTAKGVGIQLKYNGNTISFGPDSAEPGTINQIVLNSNLSGVQSFPFTASYIRTGTVTPGTLSATATFTLSYQ